MVNQLGIVMCIWKDSKVFQIVRTVMKQGYQEVRRRNGHNVLHVMCPNDIVEYQKFMDGVDKSDQHRTVGAVFSNVAHFQKWYKKDLQ